MSQSDQLERLRRLYVCALLGALLTHPPEHALAQAVPCSLELGDGMAVTRRAPFWVWEPTGFGFGTAQSLGFAIAFARAASGRLVSVAPLDRARGLGESGYEVLYTDDRGRQWSRAHWPADGGASRSFDSRMLGRRGRMIPMAFDPGSRRGVAVAGGRILSTEDEGEHWRVRRSGERGLVHAWVRGRSCVFLDIAARLWLSRDGGFAMETLAPAGSRVEASGVELVVVEPNGRRRRIDAWGVLHRL